MDQVVGKMSTIDLANEPILTQQLVTPVVTQWWRFPCPTAR